MAMIITFMFLFCIISCASASHGVEMDGVAFVGDVVKGTAKQLDAEAIKTGAAATPLKVDQVTRQFQDEVTKQGQLLRKMYTVDQATDPIGRIPKAERKLQGILQGSAINGLHWPAIGIPRSMLDCGEDSCDEHAPEIRKDFCQEVGCSDCVYDEKDEHHYCI